MTNNSQPNNREARDFATFEPLTQHLVWAVLNKAPAGTDRHIIQMAQNLRRSNEVIDAADCLVHNRPLEKPWPEWMDIVRDKSLRPFHEETYLHLLRVQRIIREKVKLLRMHKLSDFEAYANEDFRQMEHFSLTEEDEKILSWAAGYHDLFKMGYPLEFWNTPGRFSDIQRQELELHAKFFYNLGEFFNVDRIVVALSVLHHYLTNHYPRNGTVAKVSYVLDDPKLFYMLKMLITDDTYEAITAERCYRLEKISHKKAVTEILIQELRNIGTAFLTLLEVLFDSTPGAVLCPH